MFDSGIFKSNFLSLFFFIFYFFGIYLCDKSCISRSSYFSYWLFTLWRDSHLCNNENLAQWNIKFLSLEDSNCFYLKSELSLRWVLSDCIFSKEDRLSETSNYLCSSYLNVKKFAILFLWWSIELYSWGNKAYLLRLKLWLSKIKFEFLICHSPFSYF